MKRRIIDKRRKEKFMVDDEYLNGYAKLCGWQGTIVYNSLSRHCNINQEAFPSIKLMAEQHNVSKDTIIKGIKALEEWKIIETNKERTNQGTWKNNTYILTDKSEWKPKPSQPQRLGTKSTTPTRPSRRQRPDQVDDVDTKETHIKETHIKERLQTDVCGLAGKEKEEKIKSLEKPMTLEEFYNWCMKSPHKYIHLIAIYASTKECSFETKGQWQSFLKRNLRAARDLEPYSGKQISKAMTEINSAQKDYLKRWTLETLLKYLN